MDCSSCGGSSQESLAEGVQEEACSEGLREAALRGDELHDLSLSIRIPGGVEQMGPE